MEDSTLLIIISAGIGITTYILKSLFKSKCRRVHCCCIDVERDIEREQQEMGEMPEMQLPELLPNRR